MPSRTRLFIKIQNELILALANFPSINVFLGLQYFVARIELTNIGVQWFLTGIICERVLPKYARLPGDVIYPCALTCPAPIAITPNTEQSQRRSISIIASSSYPLLIIYIIFNVIKRNVANIALHSFCLLKSEPFGHQKDPSVR